MPDGMGREFAYLSSHATNRYFIPNWGSIVTLVLDYKLDMINIEFGIGALSGLYTLIVFLPSLAVSVRRLHDTGHSGWYYLLTFIPILGALFLLYFFVSDSAPEENRYGKSPKYAQETF